MQETIPLGFHQCQLIAEKDEQIPDLTALLALLGYDVALALFCVVYVCLGEKEAVK